MYLNYNLHGLKKTAHEQTKCTGSENPVKSQTPSKQRKKVSMQKINYTSRHEISKEITRACNKL